jgi:hypothetical protein
MIVFPFLYAFVAVIASSVYDTVKKIRGRWGYLGLKPRYAMAFCARRVPS